MPVAPTSPTPDPAVPATGSGLPWRRRIGPVVALFLLAPWAGEVSWGGFTANDYLLVVIFLGPLYGGAALLIRETARRTGGGWPVIVLLAAAFGLIQAGLVDQALFNRNFLDDTEFAELGTAASATWVPGLGFSAQQAFGYVGGHIALSICVPIVIVESFLAPGRRRQPWLGRPGLVVAALLYLLGSLLIFADAEDGRKGFQAAPVQVAFVLLLVVALVGTAMLPRWRRHPRPVPARAPHPIWAGLLVFGAFVSVDLVPGWLGLGVQAVTVGSAATVIVVWSRRTGWGQRHALAAWSAYLIAAAAGAYLVPNYAPASPTEALVGDLAISVITLALVGGACWRLRGDGRDTGRDLGHSGRVAGTAG
ncbi:hypothetical protein I0C86_08985 [Plantactinospora sp. S1510]|uniref:Uncharacterized protein n=1 Tax=Plantactinospora alkalitolerans TaxID=2789879 RepID=A0ABS0GSF9_9ACTN|nr:hypothetical protein [Plantactinospora alkalitolerans]MBF9129115.1 hypothetical protein [Plantactinospora alkalitolerans]